MTESQAREEICRIGQSLFQRGYVHASAGNISLRVGTGFLITPTDACLGFLDPAQLAMLNVNGTQISGATASKTIALHRQIYAASDASAQALPALCVIHTHSTHCVARSLTCNDTELLPPITPYFVMKVGHVPLIPYHRPGNGAAATAVAQTITRYAQQGTPIRAVMLSRLGPIVWHQNLASAMATLEELEETAKLMNLCAAQSPASLSELQLQELKENFGAHW